MPYEIAHPFLCPLLPDHIPPPPQFASPNMSRPQHLVHLSEVHPRSFTVLNSWERVRHRQAHWFVECAAEFVRCPSLRRGRYLDLTHCLLSRLGCFSTCSQVRPTSDPDVKVRVYLTRDPIGVDRRGLNSRICSRNSRRPTALMWVSIHRICREMSFSSNICEIAVFQIGVAYSIGIVLALVVSFRILALPYRIEAQS